MFPTTPSEPVPSSKTASYSTMKAAPASESAIPTTRDGVARSQPSGIAMAEAQTLWNRQCRSKECERQPRREQITHTTRPSCIHLYSDGYPGGQRHNCGFPPVQPSHPKTLGGFHVPACCVAPEKDNKKICAGSAWGRACIGSGHLARYRVPSGV